MEIIEYKVTQEMMRNLDTIKKGFEDAHKDIPKDFNPSEHILRLDYSETSDQEVTATTGVALNRLIKYGYPKIIITGWRNKAQFADNSVCKMLIDRGQLEIK